MPIRSLVAGALATGLLASTAGAQRTVDPQCAAPAYVPGSLPTPKQIIADACQKALDLFNFMAPQLGVSITGGNAVIGSAGSLGGLGHFTVGLRANLVQGQLPQTQGVSLGITGPTQSDFGPKSQLLGLPTADAAIGVFKGIPVGLTNVGGVDLLVSAFYVPDIDEDPVSVRTTGGRLQLGYGARVGILQETAIVPGVSLSYLRRDLPTIDLRARIGGGDSVWVTGLEANTSAWRLAASKGLTIVGLTAGVGQDRYDSHATAGAYVAPRNGIPLAVVATGVARPSQKLTRTNVFGGASLNLGLLRIAGEIGRVTGGSIVTPYNTFGSRSPDDAYTYGSVGLRLGF